MLNDSLQLFSVVLVFGAAELANYLLLFKNVPVGLTTPKMFSVSLIGLDWLVGIFNISLELPKASSALGINSRHFICLTYYGIMEP